MSETARSILTVIFYYKHLKKRDKHEREAQ